MPGTYQYDVEIKSNVAKLLSDMKQVQDRLDTVEGKEYKIKLNVDEKKLSSVISNLEKMLDSLGKGTGDFKQFENLSKELSSIVSEVQSLSKAFGKVDDSGAKTLLSSIQNIDKSLSELSQNILNVNKNMGNMGNNTSGVVKHVENIGNAATDAVKQVDKLADAQSKLGNKTNISLGDTTEIKNIETKTNAIQNQTKAYREWSDAIKYGVSRMSKAKELHDAGLLPYSDVDQGIQGINRDKLVANQEVTNNALAKGGTWSDFCNASAKYVESTLEKLGMTSNQFKEQIKAIDTIETTDYWKNISSGGWTRYGTSNENNVEKATKELNYKIYAAFENAINLTKENISEILNRLQKEGFVGQLKTNPSIDTIGETDQIVIHGRNEIDQQIAYNVLKAYAEETGKNFSFLDGGFDQRKPKSKSFSTLLGSGAINIDDYQSKYGNAINQQENLKNSLKETESQAEKTAQAVKEISSVTSQNQKKDAFQVDDSDASTVQKVADNFKEVKQNTDDATKATEKYQRVLSQVGELGVDAKVSAMYQRNDSQLESVSWKAKRDDQGQILYDKNGNIDYDFNSTVISKYEQLEKIITTADNKLRDLQKSLKDTQNLNSNASTKNIEEQIQYQKDYIQLLEQTVKAISQQDEYLLYEQQIIDARAKAEKEYNLNQGTKSDISNAKHLASEESKRQKAIEQTNRLLNRQQITIDNIEKSYNKTVNPDLDKSVSDASDLSELAKKKSEIQYLINQLNNQERNSSNEKEFLQLEKLISEYKQLAKDKLKANNPSKQELGGQDLKVLLEQQVSQYNQLISKAEKYGDATSDIVEKLKVQRDLIAQANSDGVYTAKSGLKADDYYSARDNYKISKAQFSSYETDIKNTERLIQAQKELGEATAKSRQSAKDSTQSSVDNALQDQVTAWKNIQSIREKIAKTKDSDEIANLQQVKKEYQQNYIEADKILKANSSLYDKETQIAKLEQIRLDTNKKIADYQNKQISGYDTRLEAYTKKTSGYDATIARFENGGWTSDAYLKNVQAVRDAVAEYEKILNNLKTHPELVSDEELGKLDKQEKLIKENITAVQNMSAAEKGYSLVSGQKELDKINQILKEHSAMSRSAKNQIKAYYDEIKSGNPSASLDVIHGKIMQIVNAEAEAGRAGKSMLDAIKEKAWYGVASTLGTYLGVNDIFRYVGQGVQTVRELDTALTEMRKVSDESAQSLKNYQATTFDVADAVGTTAKQIQNSTADWMRLGRL